MISPRGWSVFPLLPGLSHLCDSGLPDPCHLFVLLHPLSFQVTSTPPNSFPLWLLYWNILLGLCLPQVVFLQSQTVLKINPHHQSLLSHPHFLNWSHYSSITLPDSGFKQPCIWLLTPPHVSCEIFRIQLIFLCISFPISNMGIVIVTNFKILVTLNEVMHFKCLTMFAHAMCSINIDYCYYHYC
jgi:hypothetical protein